MSTSNLPASLEELTEVYNRWMANKEARAAWAKTEAGKEYARQKAKQHYERNKEAILEKRRVYYENNRDKVNERHKNYYHRMKQARESED